MKKLFSIRYGLLALALSFAALAGIAYAADAVKTVVSGDIHYFQNETRLNGGTLMGTPITYSYNKGTITAGTTQTQAGATVLSQEFNNVTVVTVAGDGVKLPDAYKGAHYVVSNTDAADALAVYPFLGDTIDALSANASISVPAGTTMEFWGLSTGGWRSSGGLCVASGAASFTTIAGSSTLTLSSIGAGVTAATGSAQGDGATTTLLTQVTTSATNGDAVTLPAAAAGKVYIVGNDAAANSVDVFPASGDRINKESTNTAVALAAGEAMFCIAADATYWVCVIGSAN